VATWTRIEKIEPLIPSGVGILAEPGEAGMYAVPGEAGLIESTESGVETMWTKVEKQI